MTRTTAAAMILGSALALTACSSHSGSSASSSSTSSAPASTTPSASTPASAAASNGASAGTSAGASGAPSAGGSATAPPSTPATTIPATATSPGSKPTATTSATGATPTATTSGSSTRCRNAQLKVSLGSEGAAAGNRYTPLIFTNTGTTSCTLAGHPGVSYVAGDKGIQVGDSAKRDPGTVRTVTLAPGGSASAVLHEANYQNFDQSACKAVTVRGFRVYPPGSTAAFFVPRPARECSGTDLPATALSIGVVKPGTNPSA
jgi:hypothetical protein